MAVALLAMMQVMMFSIPAYLSSEGVAPQDQRLLDWASFVLTLPALVYSASPFFRGAWRDVMHRRAGMDVPVALGIAAAFAASAWATFTGHGTVYYDSVTMFIALLLVARYVEQGARQKAGAAIEAIARQRPAVAERLHGWPRDDRAETVAAPRSRREMSCWCGPARRCRPMATSSRDVRMSRRRCSPAKACRGRVRRGTPCSPVASIAKARC